MPLPLGKPCARILREKMAEMKKARSVSINVVSNTMLGEVTRPISVRSGADEEGKYRFVIWFGDGVEDKRAGLETCAVYYKFDNCEIVGGSR